MKKTFVLFALCLCASVVKLSAQTNQASNLLGDIGTPTISAGLQQIYDAALGSTNFAVLTGGGRSLKGKNNLAFVDYIYNFNQNAGLVLGYDYTWTGSAKKFEPGNLNFVKGGFTVNADIKPFRNFGATNFTIKPFGSVLIDSSGGQVGQIVVAGVDYQAAAFWGCKLNLGGFYENRSGGNSAFDGAYLCGHIAISRGF